MKKVIKKSLLALIFGLASVGSSHAIPQQWIGAVFTGVVTSTVIDGNGNQSEGTFQITRGYFAQCRDAVNAYLAANPGESTVRACQPDPNLGPY